MGVVYEDQHLQVLYVDRGGDALLITFGNMLHRADGKNIYAGIVAEKLNLSILGFMPKAPNWYPQSSIIQAASSLSIILNRYSIKVGYGGSMGGYAILKYSNLLNLNRVIALDPQYSISIDDINDKTYYKYHNEDYHKNMKICYDDISPLCEYYIVYDPFYETDVLHVEKITSLINNLKLIRLGFSFHSSENILADTSTIQYLLLADIELLAIQQRIRYLKRNKTFHISHLLKKIFLHNPNRFFYLLKNSKFNFKNIDSLVKEKAIRKLICEGKEDLLQKLASSPNILETWLKSVHGEILCYNLLTNRLETYPEDVIERHFARYDSSIGRYLHPIHYDCGYLTLSINNNLYYVGMSKNGECCITQKELVENSRYTLLEKINTELGIYIKYCSSFITPMKDGTVQNQTKKLDRWEYFKPVEKYISNFENEFWRNVW